MVHDDLRNIMDLLKKADAFQKQPCHKFHIFELRKENQKLAFCQ